MSGAISRRAMSCPTPSQRPHRRPSRRSGFAHRAPSEGRRTGGVSTAPRGHEPGPADDEPANRRTDSSSVASRFRLTDHRVQTSHHFRSRSGSQPEGLIVSSRGSASPRATPGKPPPQFPHPEGVYVPSNRARHPAGDNSRRPIDKRDDKAAKRRPSKAQGGDPYPSLPCRVKRVSQKHLVGPSHGNAT